MIHIQHRAWPAQLWDPLFRRREAPIQKAFAPAEFLLVIELG